MEFEEWKVYIRKEELHPVVARVRHAQRIAAAFQGPVRRKSGRPWSAEDLMAPDPWRSAPKAAPKAGGVSMARQVKALSARRGKR